MISGIYVIWALDKVAQLNKHMNIKRLHYLLITNSDYMQIGYYQWEENFNEY